MIARLFLLAVLSSFVGGCGIDLDSLQCKGCPPKTTPGSTVPTIPIDGCAAQNGIPAGDGVSACPGIFDAANPVDHLCASGFGLADGKRPIDGSKLRGLGRFFVSAIAANMDKYKTQPANAECSPPSSGLRIRLLVGVGEGVGVAAMPSPCEGMPNYYDCRTAGGGFSCTWNTDPTQISNTNASNGGLCAWKGWP